METYFISEKNLQGFSRKLSEEMDVYAPYYPKGELKAETDEAHYFKLTPDAERTVDLKGIRTVEPLKIFFFKIKSRIANYSIGDLKEIEVEEGPKRAVFGVRDCDLQAMNIQDVNFLEKGEYEDPFYKDLRDSTLLFTSDCTFAGQTCFCTMLDQKPYAEEGFDLNFSSVKNGYVVEVGTEWGERIVNKYLEYFQEVGDKYKKEISSKRRDVVKALEKQNKEYDFEGSVVDVAEQNITSPRWKKEIETCIECGACTNVCPSCRCFYLRDQEGENGFERISS